jgi:TonB family protein
VIFVRHCFGVISKLKQFRLSLRYALWLALFLALACEKRSTGQTASGSPGQQSRGGRRSPTTTVRQSPTPLPSTSASPGAEAGRTPAADLANLESRVRPAVIWVTVFDSKGNLLRTASGFFISADGRFVTTARAIEGGVNAVAKTADGGIYNVSGILRASKELDLAVLQAEVKPRKLLRFLDLNKNENPPVGVGVVVIGSTLAGNEGNARQMTIAAQAPDRLEITGATPGSSIGSPVVTENGEVVGVVTAAGEKTTAHSTAALQSFLSRVPTDVRPRWPATAEATATPKATPKPRIVYAPPPAFPSGASLPGGSGTGRYRLTFDPNGNVTNVQVVKSTGNPYFDQAAMKTLRTWKSAPSHGGEVTVPVTFQTR